MIQNDGNHAATIDDVASLFQPDSLLPVQYFENFRQKVQTEPEKRLMLAVLEDALANYQKHFSCRGGRGMRLFRETEEWIFREDSGQPFSFGNICEVVGFDPQYIRQGLLRWRQTKIAELSQFCQPNPPSNGKSPKVSQPPRRLENSRGAGAGLPA